MSGFSRHSCFNELSSKEFSQEHDTVKIFDDFVKTIKVLKNHGFKKVRYADWVLNEGSPLRSKIQELRSNKNTRHIFDAILSTAQYPFVDPDSEEEKRYILENYEVEVDGNWMEGEGFSSAFINDTVTISLNTHDKWKNLLFDIRRKGEEDNCGQVINVTSDNAAESNEIKEFIDARKEITFEECSIEPKDKELSLRDDHGIDKLTAVWNKIRNSEYVISVINSLPFNPHGRRYIEKCFKDGKIHIRLVDSDEGFGMVVQTTAKDLRTTEAIGEILAKKYFS